MRTRSGIWTQTPASLSPEIRCGDRSLPSQKQASRDYLRLDNRPVILSFGGSLGARKINEAAADLIAWSPGTTGSSISTPMGSTENGSQSFWRKRGVDLKAHKNLDIREYINNMPVCMAAADLVICRAGGDHPDGNQAQGKASLLIPSPNVAENHQYHNAMALVSRNAAEILEEKDLTETPLIAMVKKMISDPIKLKEYQDNARAMAILDSSERIYQVIKEVLKKIRAESIGSETLRSSAFRQCTRFFLFRIVWQYQKRKGCIAVSKLMIEGSHCLEGN